MDEPFSAENLLMRGDLMLRKVGSGTQAVRVEGFTRNRRVRVSRFRPGLGVWKRLSSALSPHLLVPLPADDPRRRMRGFTKPPKGTSP